MDTNRQRTLDARRLNPLLKRVIDGDLPFTFVFQPIVDVRQSRVAGYEALVRFSPEIGLPPDVTFLAAEVCGLRRQLEYCVMEKAFAVKASLPPNTFLTINASPDFLLSDDWDRLLETVSTLQGTVIEITEQDSIDDYEAMRKKIEVIRARHGFVAVDDTGAGYASLRHMMELKPNFLKLDRYFIGECHNELVKATLIEMIGKVASRMDAWIIAEGVENSEELDELIRLSVPLVQGYHLGRPTSAMSSLANDTVINLQSRVSAITSDETLLRDVEPCPSVNKMEDAHALLETDHTVRQVVVLDALGRMTGFLERHPLLGVREIHDALRVQITTSPCEVLQRALIRPDTTRFDCMAAINSYGVFEGVLRVDRLMRSVLNEESEKFLPGHILMMRSGTS